jgi:hypothetical protein
LNTLAISLATACAVTHAATTAGFHVTSYNQFFTWFIGLKFLFHNHSILSINVLMCHNVVFTANLFIFISHDVRFLANSILVLLVLVSNSGLIAIALAIISFLACQLVAHIHGKSCIDIS